MLRSIFRSFDGINMWDLTNNILTDIKKKEEVHEKTNYVVSPTHGLMSIDCFKVQRELDDLNAMSKIDLY